MGKRDPRRSNVKSKWMQPNAHRPKTEGGVSTTKMLKFNWKNKQKWAPDRFFFIWHYVFNGFRGVPDPKTFKFLCKFTSNVRNRRGAAATEPSDAPTLEFVTPNRHRKHYFWLTWMGSQHLRESPNGRGNFYIAFVKIAPAIWGQERATFTGSQRGQHQKWRYDKAGNFYIAFLKIASRD